MYPTKFNRMSLHSSVSYENCHIRSDSKCVKMLESSEEGLKFELSLYSRWRRYFRGENNYICWSAGAAVWWRRGLLLLLLLVRWMVRTRLWGGQHRQYIIMMCYVDSRGFFLFFFCQYSVSLTVQFPASILLTVPVCLSPCVWYCGVAAWLLFVRSTQHFSPESPWQFGSVHNQLD